MEISLARFFGGSALTCTCAWSPWSTTYDGSTGELELAFHPLGITSLAAEAGMIGQPGAVAA